MIVKDTTDIKEISGTEYASNDNQIFITAMNLPQDVKYKVVGTVDFGKAWYGSMDDVKNALANAARKLGADAVIQLRTWHQMSGWAWYAPHGSGKAVKFTSSKKVDLSSLEGEWK